MWLHTYLMDTIEYIAAMSFMNMPLGSQNARQAFESYLMILYHEEHFHISCFLLQNKIESR